MGKFIRTNLALLRFTRGQLRQRDVSEATGIGQKTLSALETGTSKGIEFNTLIKLCEFFECQPNDILVIEEEIEDKEPKPESLRKADELIAKGLKQAVLEEPKTPEEIWAEFDSLRERLQGKNCKPKAKLGANNA